MTAAVLALTMTACGGGSNNTGNSGEKPEETATADCVYSAEQIVLEDEEGNLQDLNIDHLAYRDGRLYATGFSYGNSDMGSHVLLDFATDGSDLRYCTLLGGGLNDVISMNIGPDGNYYVVRVNYDSDSIGFSGAGSTQDEHAASDEPGEEPEAAGVGPDGVEQDDSAFTGPTVEYSEEDEPGPDMDNMEEFVTEGGESPSDEVVSDEAEEGVTSPQDEAGNEIKEADAENEHVISDVVEGDDAETDYGETTYALTCMTPDGDEIWTVPAKKPEGDKLDYYINAIACCEKGVLVSGSEGLELYSKDRKSVV